MRTPRTNLFLMVVMVNIAIGKAYSTGDYEMEYEIICSTGSVSTTVSYDFVDLITPMALGVSGDIQNNGTYLIEPLIGLSDEPLARIDSWMLY